ncbi:50S ribosomal protein L16 [Candidatus Kuenenbacteria bacterium RIFCSPLOWO2_12_FULL_42_13]|uniref:Large ribosomal subunit protein uL16 n=4 Tax=Candidatus Kueneniibacteriota TaxID=1752740 RepID=A0A0G1BUI1_9BACT|nr:MAG: 50S ribosomal protein L16 [Candidatus Kuenenbacteria bacterium GW2011_GWA2_42_15]OGG89420.1 MAG: 50S ribosomal protein L16 [Candidatus Kuenenbacteria bacterium RIFCSPHIGHO2_02_FULL_42_29]OGG89777.1 MAG: 50S ribosomal protein L16 [Candidatus Kuenenbacteria bacterium RIFCSPLOWO2_02_FULL_42_16]OGG91710.1 MAG: 50S ribosomal protein L16 [Candidatus Kuenenbacteria bacterium RIFCSPLOWO2_12_FULL_42_13]OGH01257.1 MAG: 50S ribosomal protein L16 [Candidatus Kuenenbacteria bacterium RIFCSPHIGHO2_12
MLAPRKVKHRKWHKVAGASGTKATRLTEVVFGDYGLKSTEAKWVTARQIEAARRVLVRYIRKGGQVWTRIFPDKPVTSKGSEVPMGKGKGAVDHYVFAVLPGHVLFEIFGIPESQAKEALIMAGHKLSVKTRVIKK